MKHPKERRHFPRITCDNLLGYSVLQEGGIVDAQRSDFVCCKNISETGLLFVSPDSFSGKTVLKLKLRINPKNKRVEIITMIGEVVHSEKNDDSANWQTGVYLSIIEKGKRDMYHSWITAHQSYSSQ